MDSKQPVPTVKTINIPYNGTTIAVKFVDGPGEYNGKEEIIAVTTKNTRDAYTVISGERNLIFCSGGAICSLWSVVVGDNNYYMDNYPNFFCGYVFTKFKEDVQSKYRNKTRFYVCEKYSETDTYYNNIDQPERGLITMAKAVHQKITDIMNKIAADKLMVEQKLQREIINKSRMSGKFDFSDYTYVDIIDKLNESAIASGKRVLASNVYVCGDHNKLANVTDCVVIGNNCEARDATGCIFIGQNNRDDEHQNDACDAHPKWTRNDFFSSADELDYYRKEMAKSGATPANADKEKLDLAYAFVLCARTYTKENGITTTNALYATTAKKIPVATTSIATAPITAVAQPTAMTSPPTMIQSTDPVAVARLMLPVFMDQFRTDIEAINNDPVAKKKLDISLAGWKTQYDANVDLFAEGINDLKAEIVEKIQKLRAGK